MERRGFTEHYTKKKKIRAVIDTNILISGYFWRGDPYKILSLASDSIIDLFVSTDFLKEAKRVFIRDFKLTEFDADEILNELLNFVKVFELENIQDIIKNDKTDNHIITCALEANADYVITRDTHLLNLKEYQGIKILKPEEFLEELK